jgi:hypothetical protein
MALVGDLYGVALQRARQARHSTLRAILLNVTPVTSRHWTCIHSPHTALVEKVDLGASHRQFVDTDGQRWDVWETHPRQETELRRVAPELTDGWLAFESETEKRRLVPIPDDWMALSDGELAALCARAAFVRERGGTGIWPKFPGAP